MSDAPHALPSLAGQTDWRETSVMRRDYIDMLGDYIPRGQAHFKMRRVRCGCLRLSIRSMQALRAAAAYGDAIALQALQGNHSRGERPPQPMNAPTPRFYRSDLPPRPEDMARVRRALQRGSLTRQALIERAGLSQTRTLCAVDALIVAGEVAYDQATRQFSLPRTDGRP